METIDGPMAPGGTGIIYQVTLASGAVATNPSSFADDDVVATRPPFILTESGVSLMGQSDEEVEVNEYDDFSRFAKRLLSVPKHEIDAARSRP